jgi:hypothetical protein
MAVNFICALPTVQARLRFTFLNILVTIATRKPKVANADVSTIPLDAFAIFTGETGTLVDINFTVCAHVSWVTYAFIPSVECHSRIIHHADTMVTRLVTRVTTRARGTVIESYAGPYRKFGAGLLKDWLEPRPAHTRRVPPISCRDVLHESAVSIFFSDRIIRKREHRGAHLHRLHQRLIDAERKVICLLFGAVVSTPQPRTDAFVAVEAIKAKASIFAR